MRQPISRAIGSFWCLLLLVAPAGAGAEQPPGMKRVLLLHREGVSASFRSKFDAKFVEALRSAQSVPIDLYEETIERERFPGVEHAKLVKDYLKDKYAGRAIDVLVAVGDSALTFARQNRKIFGNPAVVAVVSTAGQFDGRDDDVTGLQGGQSFSRTLELAMALRPDIQRVFVVYGSRDHIWEAEPELDRLKERISPVVMEYLRDLPLATLVSRLKALPDHSIVLFLRQTMRTESEDLDQLTGLDAVVSASRVPVFSILEDFLGRGVVGGSLWRYDTDAYRLAAMAIRIANGESASEVRPGYITNAAMVDWRQLRHWQIAETRVPAGSVILFRDESFFQQYRWFVVGGALVFTAQLALIVGLLLQRARRRRAEAEVQRTREHLAHLTRVSAMGELAASLAHELNQPLTGILCNAQAAGYLVAADPHAGSELQVILQDIVDDDLRAGEVISRMRELVSKRSTEHATLDINEVVESTKKLLKSDSIIRDVSIDTELSPNPLMAKGDRVQLQQVVLNLLLNALEATSNSGRFPRRIVVSTAMSEPLAIHVIVSDNGPGLVAGTASQVFEPFFTTKGSGMGMGLSISRSIVESHGGRIWATDDAERGAEFHFVIPALARPITAEVSERAAPVLTERSA